MSEKSKTVQIRAELDEKTWKMFEYIKDDANLQSNTEVIRMIIARYYKDRKLRANELLKE